MELDDLDLSEALESFGDSLKQSVQQSIEEERIRQRIERFSAFFNRVNSAFTFRKIKVTVTNSPLTSPAWSTSNEVTFNARVMGDLTSPTQIAVLKGANLHEVCHILYTSRESSEIGLFLQDNPEYRIAHNVLEDQRIEGFFTSKYPSSVGWFTATILKFFVDNKESFACSYPLLRGRKYLPVELRAESRNAYEFQEIIPDLSRIIDEYCTLVFPTDSDRGIELIKEFHDLLPKTDGEDQGNSPTGKWKIAKKGIPARIIDPYGHGNRPHEGIESSTSRPLSPKQQIRDRDRSKGNQPIDDEPVAQAKKPLIDISIDDIDFGDESSTPKPSKPSNGGEESLPSDDSQSSSSASDGYAEKISTLLNDLLEETLNDSAIAEQLGEMTRSINGLPSLATNNSREPQLSRFNLVPLDKATIGASLSFGRELEKLKAQFDPAWEKFRDRGRVNVQRYIRGDELDTIFDQWNEGIENATEVECVIALDISGSMSGEKARSAYRAMFAIKYALSKIEANCTVLTFSDEAQVLYRADEKASSMMKDSGTGGGTEPTEAINYATKLLAESEKPVKLFFVITDGEWYDNQEHNHEAIKRMNRAGVLTSFAYIGYEGEQVKLTPESAHYCELGAVITNPFDLVGMARVIVRHAIMRRLTNA
jgi:von Willebrand factor type A domain